MTLEEVAAESGLSVSGVRKRLRTLRARLPDLGGGGGADGGAGDAPADEGHGRGKRSEKQGAEA